MDAQFHVKLSWGMFAQENQVFAQNVETQSEMGRSNAMTEEQREEMVAQRHAPLNLVGLVFLRFRQMCVIFVGMGF